MVFVLRLQRLFAPFIPNNAVEPRIHTVNTNGNTAKEIARPSPPTQLADQAVLSYQKISADERSNPADPF
jgi:hypothetical protein